MDGKLELHMNAETAIALSEALKTANPLVLTAMHDNKVICFHLGAYEAMLTRHSPMEMMRASHTQECTMTIGVRQLIPASFSDMAEEPEADTSVRDAVRANP